MSASRCWTVSIGQNLAPCARHDTEVGQVESQHPPAAAFGARDNRGIGKPERQIGILVDELPDSAKVIRATVERISA